MSLANEVKSLAKEAGFHAVGITSAAPLKDSARNDISGARSIISVALSYLTDGPEASQSTVGSIARFAWGKDYHIALQTRLSALADAIRNKLGHNVEISAFADTGPPIDRSAAVRSGIGLQGKNSCVYAGEYGSWVVLGELLIDIELEPDQTTTKDICGDCEICMNACPTGAICAPYTLDTKKCLSQITQSKGFIPRDLRDKMETRIYGCDTCQAVCPLNRDAKPGNLPEMRPSAGLGKNPELIPLLNITSTEFKEKVKPTTVGWIGRARFRRNVAVALGNIGGPSAVPALTEALSDEKPIIRGHSAWALGKTGGPNAHTALENAFTRETDDQVIYEIRAALDCF